MRKLSMLALLALTSACDSGEGGRAAPCGRGEPVELARGTGCRYASGIIETGFICPPEFPHQFREGRDVICAAEEQRAEELPRELPDDPRDAPREPEAPLPAEPGEDEARRSHWEAVGSGWVCRPNEPEEVEWEGCLAEDPPGTDLPEGYCGAPIGQVIANEYLIIRLDGRCGGGRWEDLGDRSQPVPERAVRWGLELLLKDSYRTSIGRPLHLRAIEDPEQVDWVILRDDSIQPADCPVPVREQENHEGDINTVCPVSQVTRYGGTPTFMEAPAVAVEYTAERLKLHVEGPICGVRQADGGEGWYELCVEYSGVADFPILPGGELGLGVGGFQGTSASLRYHESLDPSP